MSVSLQVKARTAGAFWLMVFAAGSASLGLEPGTLLDAANTVATLCYIVVTVLLYQLLKPVNRSLSLLAAVFGLVGCTISLLRLSEFLVVRDLVLFGLQCLLVGYLVFQSTFLPRILGVLMIFAGLGWLTFASPELAQSLRPYNMMPGMLGEGLLLLWLLIKGVDAQKWEERART
jgi:uncharacterized protein DUF4386